MGGRRVFSGGNERASVRLNRRQRYGLDLGDGPTAGVLEIMNEVSPHYPREASLSSNHGVMGRISYQLLFSLL
jgi:hypothetical protein